VAVVVVVYLLVLHSNQKQSTSCASKIKQVLIFEKNKASAYFMG